MKNYKKTFQGLYLSETKKNNGISILQLNITDNIGLQSNILLFKRFDTINNFIKTLLKLHK